MILIVIMLMMILMIMIIIILLIVKNINRDGSTMLMIWKFVT